MIDNAFKLLPVSTSGHIAHGLCDEDRERLDRIAAALERLSLSLADESLERRVYVAAFEHALRTTLETHVDGARRQAECAAHNAVREYRKQWGER